MRLKPQAPRAETSRPEEDRAAYRRAPQQPSDKKADVGAGTADPEFVSILAII